MVIRTTKYYLFSPTKCLLRNMCSIQSRKITIAPKTGQVLIERRSDRALPAVGPRRSTLISVPVFLVILGASTLALFNYQKSSTSVVSSTLYALRVHPEARQLLGDEITYKYKMPWISGKLSQLHGDIDISYRVKGTKGEGLMRFKSVRRTRMGMVCFSCYPMNFFETLRWDLIMDDGRQIVLLDNSKVDPFPQLESPQS
ncbi:cytochrome oxidase complex assembly protein 1-domain-containing protein [Morchella snyderi]|nr:cytochrome oxidase complex assembly protein 1-domain-containing protein [Morchella snyderi]